MGMTNPEPSENDRSFVGGLWLNNGEIHKKSLPSNNTEVQTKV